jgi:hypothetical protein
MFRLAPILATAALLFGADVPSATHLRLPATDRVEFPTADNLPVLPEMSTPGDQVQTAQDDASSSKSDKVKDEPLKPTSRLALVRFVDGEFARVVRAIPTGKKGFHLKAGAPVDEKELRQALGTWGAAANPGDKAQITKLEFKERQIVVDINGGGRGKTRLRDRIHMEVGGIPTLQTTGPDVPTISNAGATLYLEFDKPLPDMTPDQLKQYLSCMLDFSKQPSAAVQWVETLPPQMQTAIKERRAIVGMDRDTVLAAMGRPDRKVRERTPDGTETEDWIYGKPPAKTVFVKFEGDRVTQVEQFPR